jgi:hypothetical protein
MPRSSPHQRAISELISYANERRHLYAQQQAATLHQIQHAPSTRETFGFSEAGAAALGFVTLCMGALGMEGTTKV